MLETLKVRSITQADKNHSILISCPAPMNLILFFVGPGVMSSDNQQRLNQNLLLLAYTPVLLASTALFVLGEVAMYPFVYFKMLFHKLTMVWVYSKSFRVSRADKFANFIMYCMHGPFTLAGNSIIDTYFFVRHLLLIDLQKIKHKTQ